MKQYVIAGNWKMNNDLAGSSLLAQGIVRELPSPLPGVTVVICPPFTSLASVAGQVKGSPIKLGAQNMSDQDDGALTGEISWRMLKSVGCEYVILGHSERRQYFRETDAYINAKAKTALANGLLPILCVGETLEEREANVTEKVVTTQVRGVLAGIGTEQMARVVIAYEPVWAIGTGRNATPEQAQEVHGVIRRLVSELYGEAVAKALIIQYGGSVKPDNAAAILSQNDINGALVGGACLKSDSFSAIVRGTGR